MASTATYKCFCGVSFTARTADRKRGWARYCSKSCKARKQEARTGAYAAYKERGQDSIDPYDVEDPSWDSHKDSF